MSDVLHDVVLPLLEDVRQSGGSFTARCPAHDDNQPSLSVSVGKKQPVTFYCQAGCDQEDVLAALKLTWADLCAPKERQIRPVAVAQYEYVDEQGTTLFAKVRLQPKGFQVKRPNGKGGWTWSLGDTRRVLYRLPEVLKGIADGRTIYLVEGEKDVHAAEKAGAVATCNFDGASKQTSKPKWKPGYGDTLKGAHVVIVADNDEAGRAHARAAAKDLQGKAASVRIVRGLVDQEHADLTDHLAAGHGIDDLVPLEDQAVSLKDDPAPEPMPEKGNEREGRGPSQSTQLVKVARDRFEMFISDDGRPYAVRKDGPNLALPLRGRAGLRSTLARIFAQEQSNTAASQSALADAMTVLEGFAQEADARVPHLRTARDRDRIVVDLGTPDGRCVIVGPDGWSRETRSPVLFRRSGAMRALPAPLREGDGLERLAGLLNMGEEGFRLLVGWLVAAFIPDLPHPILTFRGEQGTGKSKSAQMVIGIIDPSGAPKRTAPRDVKSWGVQAFNSWALCLDNISHVPDWLSDALCRAVTGDGIVDRALYSDDDVVVLEFRRVLALTTIDAGALAGDLAERLLTIELELIPDNKRREEAELDRAYADAHASILASLFDLLAKVLKALPDVNLSERPRMADFARILAAVDQVQGWETLKTYKAGARDAVSDVLDGDQFAQALVELVDSYGGKELSETAADILARITPERPPKSWPKDATRTGGKIKRLAPALRTIGIEVDDTRRGPAPKRQRLLTLSATPERLAALSSERRHAAASTASISDQNSGLTSGNGVDTGESLAASTALAEQTVMDAGDADMDAGVSAVSTPNGTADQRERAGMDAGDAMDAGMHPVSETRVGTCAGCSEQMRIYEAGRRTHPDPKCEALAQ